MSLRDQLPEFRVLLPKDLQPITSLDAYKDQGGLQGLEKAREIGPEAVIETIKQAKLRGRGGAGFPTFIKWAGVRSDESSDKFIVCNGSEGEPGTYKDRYLLSKNPYPLLEGITIAGETIGVKKAYLGIKEKYKTQVENLRKGIQEMEAAGVIPEGYIHLALGPDDYLFGEESALIEFLDTGNTMPRVSPPYIQGVNYSPISASPTVVNNIETFNHVTHIMRNGAEWFQSIGDKEDTPGTMIFTLCGDVKYPGMYELPLGKYTLNDLIMDIGGGPAGDYPIKAVFSGVANPIMTPEQFDTPLGFDALRAAKGGLGSAGMIVYDESVCAVKIAALLSEFLSLESCGQCMPCKGGSNIITGLLQKIESGLGTEEDLEAIAIEAERVTNQTRCFLSNEEQIIIRSFLDKFGDEFKAHLGRPCPLPREAFMAKVKYFDEDTHTFTYEENWRKIPV